MTRCSQCGSKLESWELVDGRCPFCFPSVRKLVRLLNDEELKAILDAGCHNGHGPWTWMMGTPYCKTCGESPPTHIRSF